MPTPEEWFGAASPPAGAEHDYTGPQPPHDETPEEAEVTELAQRNSELPRPSLAMDPFAARVEAVGDGRVDLVYERSSVDDPPVGIRVLVTPAAAQDAPMDGPGGAWVIDPDGNLVWPLPGGTEAIYLSGSVLAAVAPERQAQAAFEALRAAIAARPDPGRHPVTAQVVEWDVVDGDVLGAVIHCPACMGTGGDWCDPCDTTGLVHRPYKADGHLIDLHDSFTATVHQVGDLHVDVVMDVPDGKGVLRYPQPGSHVRVVPRRWPVAPLDGPAPA